jgi:hypothetical protein
MTSVESRSCAATARHNISICGGCIEKLTFPPRFEIPHALRFIFICDLFTDSSSFLSCAVLARSDFTSSVSSFDIAPIIKLIATYYHSDVRRRNKIERKLFAYSTAAPDPLTPLLCLPAACLHDTIKLLMTLLHAVPMALHGSGRIALEI